MSDAPVSAPTHARPGTDEAFHHAIPSSTGLALFARASWAIAMRHLYKWITKPSNFVPTFMFPLLFFTSFSGALSSLHNIRGFHYAPGYTSFIFVFSLLQTCMFGGLATGFTIAADFETGFAQRLLLTTERRAVILAGYLISTFTRAALMSCVVTGVALIIGLRLPHSVLHILGLYGLALLMSFVGTLWASGVMFRGRSSQMAPVMQFPMFILLFLAPVYVPLALLPHTIHNAARWNPVTYVMEAGRSLLAGGHAHSGQALEGIALLIALGLVWSLRGLRSAVRAG